MAQLASFLSGGGVLAGLHGVMKFGNTPGFSLPIGNKNRFAGTGRLAGHIDRIRRYDHSVSHRQNARIGVGLVVGGNKAIFGGSADGVGLRQVWTAPRRH